MKNVIYYSVLIILWAIIHILFGTLMLVIGVVEGPFPSILIALVIATLIPEYWLISIGLTMYARGLLARKILGNEKKYSKRIPTILVVGGFILVVVNVLLSLNM